LHFDGRGPPRRMPSVSPQGLRARRRPPLEARPEARRALLSDTASARTSCMAPYAPPAWPPTPASYGGLPAGKCISLLPSRSRRTSTPTCGPMPSFARFPPSAGRWRPARRRRTVSQLVSTSPVAGGATGALASGPAGWPAVWSTGWVSLGSMPRRWGSSPARWSFGRGPSGARLVGLPGLDQPGDTGAGSPRELPTSCHSAGTKSPEDCPCKYQGEM
jgi:hypothetical protein